MKFTRPDKAKGEASLRDMPHGWWLALVAALVVAIGFVASGIFTANTTAGAVELVMATLFMTASATLLVWRRRQLRGRSAQA